MKISIACVGKLKERYWEAAAEEYIKRLKRFADIKIVEVREERLPEQASEQEERQVVEAESLRLINQARERSYVIALDRNGKMLDSLQLAQEFEKLALAGRSEIIFMIGGSLGLSKNLLAQANETWSFSKMTFPHQLMRIILLEQIYRGFKIIRGETYHK
ncbi:MAG TPA: 23S rRNA (pseudouridine(1915)-N(3))-methyltransferase RlmH [Clostridiales bacterium]|nr:23S rRNA (pseudouridine(1915)-N(3))-methyltransferase RlmH [Clostridiales bacterium]